MKDLNLKKITSPAGRDIALARSATLVSVLRVYIGGSGNLPILDDRGSKERVYIAKN